MVIITLIQAIAVLVFLDMDAIRGILKEPEFETGFAPWARSIIANFRPVVLSFFITAWLTLIASIALLKQKILARLAFIGVMALSTPWFLGSLFSRDAWVLDIPRGFRLFTTFMSVSGMVFSAWLIKKLVSEQIQNEFISI